MTTQSYSDLSQYTGSVEAHLVPPQVTPYEEVSVDKAKELLDPNASENLNTETNGKFQYDANHISPGDNRDEKQGWTERDYVGDPTKGGMVRNALLSGSYGELKKLRVDSEVNSETVTTSWSASIGENLRVGNNVGVAGYVNLGDTASLLSGSNTPGQDPTRSFAPNSENVPDLRLVVSNSALVQDRLYVGKSASISGGLDVKEDVRVARDLFVTGNTELTGNLRVVNNSYLSGNLQVVGNEAVTGSLHVSKSIYGSENMFLTGNAQITGNLNVVGDEAITGSLYVSQSINGHSNLYIKGDAVVTNSLYVNGDADVSGNLTVHQSQSIHGDVVVDNKLTVYGNTTIEDNITVNGDAKVTGSLEVDGKTDLNGDLEVDGNITGSKNLLIKSNSLFEGNVVIQKDLIVNGTASYLNVDELYVRDKSITVASGAVSPGAADGAGFNIDGADVHFHYTASTDRMGLNKGLDISGSTNITGNLNVTDDIRGAANMYLTGNLYVTGTANIQTLRVTESYVNSQYVTNSVVISQSVQTQSVVSSSLQDVQIVSGNAEYIKVEKLEVTSTDPAEFHGDVIVDGNVSCSNTGQFKDIEVERSASIGKYLEINNNDGQGNSVVINTGSIDARQSDLYVHNITGSGNLYMSGAISASTFYGDGRHLINVTASAASSSTWKSYLDFEAGATQRLTHPFDTTDVFVQVYRWDDPNFHPDLANHSSFSSPATRVNEAVVKVIENGIVDISNATAVNGYAVISDAGMIITGSVDLLQVAADYAEFNITDPKAIYRFDHKLGTKNLIVQVYQNTDIKDGAGTIAPVQIFPEQISIPDNSHVDIVFGRAPINGYIVLGKAGHVIKQFDIGDYIDTYNIHWGTQGDWSAHSFTAETMSGDAVVAGEYVDATKVGNRDTGAQYYASCSWGSYTEYTDTGINEWVRYSNDELDVRQVSNIDKNGNLKIRGNLTTNGTFTTSDRNYKKEITPITGALDAVKEMEGVSFRWKENNEQSLGVIAQNIGAIYPELTKVIADFEGKERMTVQYEGLIGVLIEAVKTLSNKVEVLEQRLNNENR